MVITIIECNVGNIFSLRKAFSYWGVEINVTQDEKLILNSDKIVLPGVGAFGVAVNEIRSAGMFDVVLEFAAKKKPLLGICVGMQILFEKGTEHGIHEGLGLLKGQVVPIPGRTKDGGKIRLPHIGWEKLRRTENTNWKETLLSGLGQKEAVYFAHSFHAIATEAETVISDIRIGGHDIAAFVQNKHIMGAQFHPEKSGLVGLKIIKNFISL